MPPRVRSRATVSQLFFCNVSVVIGVKQVRSEFSKSCLQLVLLLTRRLLDLCAALRP